METPKIAEQRTKAAEKIPCNVPMGIEKHLFGGVQVVAKEAQRNLYGKHVGQGCLGEVFQGAGFLEDKPPPL